MSSTRMASSAPRSWPGQSPGAVCISPVGIPDARPFSDDKVDLMLLDIAKLPTAENSAIHLHPSDNVAVARVPIMTGAELRVDGVSVVALDPVPAGHKIALRSIHAGEMVERYGQSIGRA